MGVTISSSESGHVRPPASNFSTRRANRSSQGLSTRGSTSGGSTAYGNGGVNINPSSHQPMSAQDSAHYSQWNVILEALAEIQSEISKLKVDRQYPSNSPCVPLVSDVPPTHQPL
ncbi:hypothetical protein E2C01_080346 [Portunus trituberculatus]|uniref:Uncharacterized protein n=1 Tax=Portunus trituberculatus TaxID=210409 RepID=A0A5B7ISZ6_PORTR|nr:hypothetical protein [Portunus trituberculatus]